MLRFLTVLLSKDVILNPLLCASSGVSPWLRILKRDFQKQLNVELSYSIFIIILWRNLSGDFRFIFSTLQFITYVELWSLNIFFIQFFIWKKFITGNLSEFREIKQWKMYKTAIHLDFIFRVLVLGMTLKGTCPRLNIKRHLRPSV